MVACWMGRKLVQSCTLGVIFLGGLVTAAPLGDTRATLDISILLVTVGPRTELANGPSVAGDVYRAMAKTYPMIFHSMGAATVLQALEDAGVVNSSVSTTVDVLDNVEASLSSDALDCTTICSIQPYEGTVRLSAGGSNLALSYDLVLRDGWDKLVSKGVAQMAADDLVLIPLKGGATMNQDRAIGVALVSVASKIYCHRSPDTRASGHCT